jgi:hypothetical protein
MASSLVKFAGRSNGNGRGKLFWGRVEQDGLPFRGQAAPNYTEEEYEERVARVADPHNGTFRTWIQQENKAYLSVLDMVTNGWAVGIYQERWRASVRLRGRVTQRMVVYIEWIEYYLEDGSRTQINLGRPTEQNYGQTAGPFPPLPHQGGNQ